MITVLVTLIVHAEFKQNVLDIFARITPTVRAEQGCQRYDLAISTEDEQAFYLTELWDSQADLQAHLASEHMVQFFAESKDWLKSVEIKTYEASEFRLG